VTDTWQVILLVRMQSVNASSNYCRKNLVLIQLVGITLTGLSLLLKGKRNENHTKVVRKLYVHINIHAYHVAYYERFADTGNRRLLPWIDWFISNNSTHSEWRKQVSPEETYKLMDGFTEYAEAMGGLLKMLTSQGFSPEVAEQIVLRQIISSTQGENK
jgi:hypothetical protein